MSAAPATRQAVASETTAEGCFVEKFTVHSPGMGREVAAWVVLPPEYGQQPEKRYPILYALHGRGAPYDTFSHMVPLREALREKPLIVAGFDADNASLYLDSPHPQPSSRDPQDKTLSPSRFTTFFFDEFIPCLDRHYRTDAARRMLTGFSMGGYGAFHYWLSGLGRFASVSSLSGWFPSWLDGSAPEWGRTWMQALVGPHPENAAHYEALDPFTNLRKMSAAGVRLPPLLLCCGTEDHLLESNRHMHAFLGGLGIPHEYVETSGGHDWPYWRDASAGVIDFHWRTLPGA